MHLRPFVLSALAALGSLMLAATQPALPAAADEVRVAIQNFAFQPPDITVTQGDTIRWTNSDGAPHTASGSGFDTGTLTTGQSGTARFDTPGTFTYVCKFHSSMKGTVTVRAATAPPATPPDAIPLPISGIGAPVRTAPPDGSTLASFAPLLLWQNPTGATQYHLQLIPANNDGPGLDIHAGSPSESFAVLPPPQWYGMLPGMTYTWRVRVSGASSFVGIDDPSWGAWGEAKFRTPAASSSGITAVDPLDGAATNSSTPSLTWANSQKEAFYYELQLSKDRTFNTDPATATAIIYSALLHGGITTPANTYKVPANAPLDSGSTYFWRVRPRVQGDGAPVDWSKTFTLNTSSRVTR